MIIKCDKQATQVMIANIFDKLIISALELFSSQKVKKILNRLKSKKINSGTIKTKTFNDIIKSFVIRLFFFS